MTSLPLILAQDAAPAGPNLFSTFLPLIAIMGIFYFLLIRPQRQQQKKQDEMRKNLSRNDRVVTIGGIHGVVSGLTETTATVRVDEGVSMKFDRSAIARVLSEKSEKTGKEEEKATEDDAN